MDPALQVTQVRAGRTSQPDKALPWSYRFFGSALVGRTPHHLPLGVRATIGWAAAEARRNVRTGRARPDEEEVLGLRLAYQALKAEATAVRAGGDTRGDVLASVIALRHRQRAAVLMRYGLRMSEGDVARVLGVRPTQVQPILACATAAVARRLGRPVDLSRAMRAAAAEPLEPSLATDGPVARVVRLPRRSPVSVLIEPIPVVRAEPQRRRGVWSLVGRIAAAATVGMLFAWATWPVH